MNKKHAISFLLVCVMVLSLSVTGFAAGKDTLVVPAYATVSSYDPNWTEAYDTMVMTSVFDTLVKYGADGEPEPCLAESWEDNGDSVTFHLRQGVKFSDGTDFNADAVVKNFDYHMNGGYGPSFMSYASAIEKIDDYTVVMTKATPYASLVEYLCSYLFIVSPTAYEADPEGFAMHPVGTGAFVLDSVDETTGYAYLSANEEYFLGKPGFEKLEVHSFLDSNTALIALENGEIDLYTQPTVTDYMLALNNEKLSAEKTNGWTAMTVTLSSEQLNSDPYLRKAVFSAINRENAAIYMDLTDVTPSTDLFAAPIMGDYAGQVELGGYDPEMAKEYLAQSNYAGEIIEFNIMAPYSPIATSIQYDLDAVGIRTQINIVDDNAWVEKFFSGTIGIDIGLLGGSYACLEELMQTFTGAGYFGALGIVPTNPALDAAVADLANYADPAERAPHTLEAYKQMADMSFMLGLYDTEHYVIYNANLSGVDAKWAASMYPYLWQVREK